MDYRARWQNRRRHETRRRLLAIAALSVGALATAVLVGTRRPMPLAWAHEAARAAPPLLSAAGQSLYVASPGSRIEALRTSTGRALWPTQPDAPTTMVVPPVPTRYRIICVSDAGAIWALDRRTGQEVWRVETGAPVRCVPLVSGGTVLVGNDDGVLLALDTSSGVERWRFAAGAAINSRCVVGGGGIVFAAADGRIYGLDPRTGRERWTQPLGAPVLADLALVGSQVVAITEAGEVNTISPESGLRAAKALLPDAGVSRFRPLAADGQVIIASAEGWLSCYAVRDLALVWQRKAAAGIGGAPVLLGERLYCPTMSGWIRSVDPTSGRARRGWRAGPSGTMSLLVADDLLLAALPGGRIAAYRPGPVPRQAAVTH